MNICVFASANAVAEAYLAGAEELGFSLGREGHALVFGGYADGLMKACADGFARAGAEIVGVVTDLFEETNQKHPGLTRVVPTRDLSERKAEMIRLSDAFIALPGGVGTLDELFTVLSLKSCGQIPGPVILYNLEGYWDSTLHVLEEMRLKGFIREDMRGACQAAATADEVRKILSGRAKKA